MKYKSLGDTNIKISSIGLGTNFYPYHSDKNHKLIHLMQEALDLDLNFFDTAEVYLNGNSEKLIGKAFKKRRSEIFISTKVSPENCSYEMVIKSCKASLQRLQTDYIDLYQIHWPNPLIPIDETISALEKLVRLGKVKYFGVSNFSLRQLKAIQKTSSLPIVSLQTEYNLLDRLIENELLPYCEKNKITIIAYTPLNSGNIFKKEKYSKIFSNLSRKYNKTVSQIILNFLISHPSVVAIPSTTSLIHLKENAQSTDFVLEKKDIQLLARTFATKLTYIDTRKILVSATSNHFVYKTIKEAMVNKLNFFPSPNMLSEDIKKGDFLKPVKVRPIQKKDGNFEYELLDGRIRYWAWVIAYNGNKPIPATVEN